MEFNFLLLNKLIYTYMNKQILFKRNELLFTQIVFKKYKLNLIEQMFEKKKFDHKLLIISTGRKIYF